jgi:hypothetical protein
VLRQKSFVGISVWLLAHCSAALAADLRPDEIVTALPKDAIPAILSPSFQEARQASWLSDKTPVVGVEMGDEARAYPVPILSRHEIVNDKIAAIPIAVTW